MTTRVVVARAPVHVHIIDPRTVRAVRRQMKSDEMMVRLAETFAAFSDPARAKILCALEQAELCVCDLAEIIGISDSAVSHQLRILRVLELVKYRRDGRVVYYSLADHHVRTLLAQGLEHVEER